MRLPHERHLTPAGWALIAVIAFWVVVGLLLVRCA